MRSSRAGFARPARSVPRSRFKAPMAFSILSDASALIPCGILLCTSFHDRSDFLSQDDPLNIAWNRYGEYDERNIVVHAERSGCRIHDAKIAVEHIEVRQLIELLCGFVLERIGGINPVHFVLGHQNDLGFDFSRAERSRRIRREERIAGSGREDDDAPLLEMADRAAADIRLRDLLHGDRGLDTGRHIDGFKRILQSQRIHHCSQHAHVIRCRAVDSFGGACDTAPDIPSSDYDSHFDAKLHDFLDLLRDGRNDLCLDAIASLPRQRFTADLQDDPFVDGILQRQYPHVIPRFAFLQPCPRTKQEAGRTPRPACCVRLIKAFRADTERLETTYSLACAMTSSTKLSTFFSRPSPSSKRAKRRMEMFSPIVLIFSFSSVVIVLSGSLMKACSMRQNSS
ncbi:hypothetical protein BN871_EQ_00080 [Paenibacillus sp. P22]|nr:hypothetical protein BN871_EQ_00080 [Paenibacillus sp. P22]